MTKLITAFIVIAFLFAGWHLFFYWERVKNEEENQRKEAAGSAVVPQQLAGMPQELEDSLQAAEKQGGVGLRSWLKFYGNKIQDPRKAWIQLDYCLAISRDEPAEARRVFADVKGRTPANSPVYPRVKQLEKTYQ